MGSSLAPLRNSYNGRRCFIVATGPSLAYKNLSFLKDEVTIALNLASLTLDIFNIKPTFNIIADKYQYTRYKEVYEKLTYNTLVKKIIVASACDTFPAELIDSETYFVPHKLPQEKPSFSENPIDEGFSRGKTVAFDAIQLAYYLGFSEIYILGMDLGLKYDWGVDGHCYEIHRNERFLDVSFAKSNDYEIQRGLPGHPEYFEFISECMELAKQFFDSSAIKVYNDISSKLEVFTKIDVLRKFGASLKVVAFVPAKGTSSRVKDKNKKLLGNKPLFLHVLDTLLKSMSIDEVYLDTESDEILSLAGERNYKPLKREASLATNDTDGNKLLLNEAVHVDADIYVQVLPTAPFLSRETVDNAVFKLIMSKENDSLFGVIKSKFYLWDEGGNSSYDIYHIPNSVDLKDTIIETMSLYVIRKEALFKGKSRIGEKPIFYNIPYMESFDTNTYEDFELANILLKGKEALKNESNA